MTDKSGEGILVYSLGEPLFTDAKHYSKAVIEKAKYSLEMEPSEYVHFNVDHKQLGVGGNTSWGATALPAYQLCSPTFQGTITASSQQGGLKPENAFDNRPGTKWVAESNAAP